MSGIIVPILPKEIRQLEAYHASRKPDIVPDENVLMLCTDDFLQDIEGEGIRRKVMADLGFNMEPGAEAPERIKLDLDKGYAMFNPTKEVRNPDGSLRHYGDYEIRKGKGRGSLIIQGDKHGVS